MRRLGLRSLIQQVLLFFVLHSCFSRRYINALEAPSATFAKSTKRMMLRGDKELKDALTAKKRLSNSEYLLSQTKSSPPVVVLFVYHLGDSEVKYC